MKVGLIIYGALVLLAVILGQFRNDITQIKKDVKFIFEKGNPSHKMLLWALIPLTLPFTIPYTIRNIRNRRKKHTHNK